MPHLFHRVTRKFESLKKSVFLEICCEWFNFNYISHMGCFLVLIDCVCASLWFYSNVSDSKGPFFQSAVSVSLEIPVMLSRGTKQGCYCVQVLLCLLDPAGLLLMTKNRDTQWGKRGRQLPVALGYTPRLLWLFHTTAMFRFGGKLASESQDYNDRLLISHAKLQCLSYIWYQLANCNWYPVIPTVGV